jgi:low temperature requirement protein LtrA
VPGEALSVSHVELFFDLVYVFAVLIALGESILAIGVTFAGLRWTAPVVAAFLVGFLATASFWWIYFGRAEEAARTIAGAADPTRVARAGYAYAHGLMVAGTSSSRLGSTSPSPTPLRGAGAGRRS